MVLFKSFKNIHCLCSEHGPFRSPTFLYRSLPKQLGSRPGRECKAELPEHWRFLHHRFQLGQRLSTQANVLLQTRRIVSKTSVFKCMQIPLQIQKPLVQRTKPTIAPSLTSCPNSSAELFFHHPHSLLPNLIHGHNRTLCPSLSANDDLQAAGNTQEPWSKATTPLWCVWVSFLQLVSHCAIHLDISYLYQVNVSRNPISFHLISICILLSEIWTSRMPFWSLQNWES